MVVAIPFRAGSAAARSATAAPSRLNRSPIRSITRSASGSSTRMIQSGVSRTRLTNPATASRLATSPPSDPPRPSATSIP